MISDFKRQLQSPAYKPFLWFAAFLMIGAYSIPMIVRTLLTPGQQWAFQINGHAITVKELQYEVGHQERLLAQVRARFGNYANYVLPYLGLNADPIISAKEKLIRDQAISQAGKKMGIYLHDDYVKEMLRNKEFVMRDLIMALDPSILDDTGVVNQRKLAAFLQSQKRSMADFDQKVEQLLVQRMVKDIAMSAYYTPLFETAEEQLAQMGAKTFSILALPFEKILAQEKEKTVTTDELKAFFDQENKRTKRYLVPEKRTGIVWKFGPDTYQATEEEIAAFYENNKERLFVESPLQVQVRMILIKAPASDRRSAFDKIMALKSKLAVNPTSFEAVAAQESHDEESAKNGGLLPFFSKGQKDPVLERAAFQLKNDGDISDVIELENGYALVQRVGRKPKEYVSLEKARQSVIEKLSQERFKKTFSAQIKSILESGETAEKQLEDLVRTKGAVAQEIAGQERDETKLMTTLFKLKRNDATFYFEGNEGFVVKLTEIQEQFVPSVTDIEDIVRDNLYEVRARKAMAHKLLEMRADAKTIPFEEIAQKYAASLTRTNEILPDSKTELEELSKKEVPVAALAEMSKVGTMLMQETQAYGYLIRLDAIQGVDVQSIDPEAKKQLAKLQDAKREIFLNSFVASLCRNATIVSNEHPASSIDENYLP